MELGLDQHKDDFKFYVPIDIEKAQEETEESGKREKMILGGIASTGKKDSQGESLSPNNYNLDQMSLVNWEHSTRPKDTIGEVIEKDVNSNRLYIKTELFPENETAKEVWELAKNLHNSGKGNRLGYSVEGKVTERDKNDPNKIKAARLTGVALCRVPVNSDSLAGLIEKGFTDNTKAVYKADEDIQTIELNGVKYKAYLDDEGNPKLEKMTTAQVPQKESMETDVRYTDDKKIKKADAFTKIFDTFNDITVEQAKKVYLYAEKLEKSYNENFEFGMELNEDTLNKALQELGVEEETTEKSEKTDEEVSKSENTEKAYKKKGDDKDSDYEKEEENDDEEEDEAEKGKMKKGESSATDISGMADKDLDALETKLKEEKTKRDKRTMGGETSKQDTGEVKKGEETNIDAIAKAVADKLGGYFEDVISKSESTKEEADKKFAALGAISKSANDALIELQGNVESVKGTTDELGKRLGFVEKQPVRKSLTENDYKERFEKSEGGGEKQGKTYSLSKQSDRIELMNYLHEKSGIEKGQYNEFYGEAVKNLNITKSLRPDYINELEKEGIHVTR